MPNRGKDTQKQKTSRPNLPPLAKETSPEDFTELRRRAEKRQKERQVGSITEGKSRQTAGDVQRVIQELQIHQIELEMQNEQLYKSQAEAEERLALYTELYDFAPVGYLTLDRDGVIRRINFTGAQLLGSDRAPLAGRRFAPFVSAKDRSSFNGFLQKVFASGTRQTCEVVLRRQQKAPPSDTNEDRRSLVEAGQLIVNIDGIASEEARKCRIVITDITEHKRMEMLRIEKEGFSQAFDSLDALVYVTDMKTYEVVFINAYGKSLWGDIKGKICWQTIQAGQTGPCAFCTNSKLIGSDGKPTEGVAWEFQNTVNKRWYDCRDRCLCWPDGRLVRIEIATDITDRKRAEEELAHKAMLLEAQAETSIDGILAVDNDGNVLLANKRFGEIWRLPQPILDSKEDKTLLESVLKQLKYPEEFYRKVTYLYEHQDEKSRDEVEFADGRCFDRYSSPMKSTDGKYLGRIWFFRDITERKQAEEQLMEREQELHAKTISLEELNVALRVLLEHREKDQDELQDNVMTSVQQLVVPLFEKLKVCPLSEKEAAYVNALEYALQDITSPFVKRLAHKTWNFTPKEIQVAGLIKDGKSTKEIADFLNLSERAVDFHRFNIRKKLGLNKQNTNLRSYLTSLS